MSITLVFPIGFKPVLKHADHDQADHGNREGGAAETESVNEVSASIESTGLPGLTKYTYGNYTGEILRDKSLGDEEYLQGAVSEFGFWQGNYASRIMAASLMGLETPDATGSEDMDKAMLSALQTGQKFEGNADTDADVNQRADEFIQTNLENTLNLMVGAVNSIPTTLPLYRGMTVASDDPVTSLKEGDSFSIPLSSFSFDKSVSESFARPNQLFGNAPRTSVIFQMETGAKGASNTDLDSSNTQIQVKSQWTTVPDEVISQGKYVVTGVSKESMSPSPYPNQPSQSALIIKIKHTAVYDVTGGRYVPVK